MSWFKKLFGIGKRDIEKTLLDEQLDWLKRSVTFLKELNPKEADRLMVEILKLLDKPNPSAETVNATTRLVLDSLARERLIRA